MKYSTDLNVQKFILSESFTDQNIYFVIFYKKMKQLRVYKQLFEIKIDWSHESREIKRAQPVFQSSLVKLIFLESCKDCDRLSVTHCTKTSKASFTKLYTRYIFAKYYIILKEDKHIFQNVLAWELHEAVNKSEYKKQEIVNIWCNGFFLSLLKWIEDELKNINRLTKSFWQ